MNTTRMPERSPNLLVETFVEEIVICQPSTQNLHRLEAEAAQVFLHCDGLATRSEVAEKLFPGDALAMERLEYILHRLEELKLIQSSEINSNSGDFSARRAFLKKAAVLVPPVIFTFMMPTAAQAQSAGHRVVPVPS